MPSNDNLQYPVIFPVNDSPERWLNGDPDRIAITCRIEQHEWVRIPRTFDDYVICADCGKRQGWTAEKQSLLVLVQGQAREYIRHHPLPPGSNASE